MAATLMSRAVSRTESVGAFRFSLNLLRNFSAAASPPSENPSSDVVKPKRKKKKNLLEVAQFLPNWGIGYHLAKAQWNGISYEITKIILYKDGRHGKAWGIVHKDGIEALKSIDANKYLKKVGFGRDDMFFWKQVGKALLCTYTVFGLAWIYNDKSPLGWWTLKPRPKEERELAHLYERREFPYPGDTEAMEDFVAKGGMIGTAIGPKGIVESEGEADNYQKDMEKKRFDKEAQKL